MDGIKIWVGECSPKSGPSSSPLWLSKCGWVGACLYLAGAALPFSGNLPLVGFAACSTLTIATRSSSRFLLGWPPLTLAIVAFLCAMALSTAASADVARSLLLSAPFLPAVLLFIVLPAHGSGPGDVRRLYLVLSATSLGLATILLQAVWSSPQGIDLFALVPRLGIPILVVPNDVTFLAVLAPFSLVLLCREPRGSVGLVTALSLLLSVGAICAYRSRTAVLTMSIALACAAVLSRCYRRRMFLTVAPAATLLLLLLVGIDVPHLSGPSLLTKFLDAGLQGRTAHWADAWTMFLAAPLLGWGPHTFGLLHTPPWPHNLYLEVLAEQGLLGLTALGGMLACALVGGLKLRHAQSEDTRLLGAGALASLVGLCSAGVVELTLVREWVVTTLFMLLGVIEHLLSSERVGSSGRLNT